MANVEKMTITLGRAAAIFAFLFTVYLTVTKAVSDGLDRVNENHAKLEKTVNENTTQIQVITTKINYIDQSNTEIKGSLAQLTSAIMTYREAIKPEEPKNPTYRNL